MRVLREGREVKGRGEKELWYRQGEIPQLKKARKGRPTPSNQTGEQRFRGNSQQDPPQGNVRGFHPDPREPDPEDDKWSAGMGNKGRSSSANYGEERTKLIAKSRRGDIFFKE